MSVPNGLQVFGIPCLEGLLSLADVLVATFFTLYEVYHVVGVTGGLTMCVVCPSRYFAAYLCGVNHLQVHWTSLVAAVGEVVVTEWIQGY